LQPRGVSPGEKKTEEVPQELQQKEMSVLLFGDRIEKKL